MNMEEGRYDVIELCEALGVKYKLGRNHIIICYPCGTYIGPDHNVSTSYEEKPFYSIQAAIAFVVFVKNKYYDRIF